MSLDTPTIVSGYRCNKCGIVQVNKGNLEENMRFMEHCRKPVLELPAGFVLRQILREPQGFYIVGNPTSVTSTHERLFDAVHYNYSGSFAGQQIDSPESTLKSIANGYHRFMIPEDIDEFNRFNSGLIAAWHLPNGFIFDPEGIPAFDKLLREAEEHYRRL